VLYGWLALSHVTLIPGLWKAGKSTLIGHIIKAIATGQAFCGLTVKMGRILVISEESADLWYPRLSEAGLPADSVEFLLRPFPMGRPSPAQWIALIREIVAHVTDHVLVVIDSIYNLWGPENENDNSEMLRWLAPLEAITKTGVALLLAGHPSKAEQSQGRAARGGGAIGGWVSILAEFRRYTPDDAANAMRVLNGFSRFTETPTEMVIELRNDVYHAVGTRATVRATERDHRRATVLAMLPADPPGFSAAVLLEGWVEDDAPPRRTLDLDLTALWKDKRAGRTGKGRSKTDPYCYYRRKTPVGGADR
jgi:hypothetical protein